MKRTREKTEQQDEEEVRSQLFDSEVQNPKQCFRVRHIIDKKESLEVKTACLGTASLCRWPLPCVPVETELSVSPPMYLWKTLSLDVLLLKVFCCLDTPWTNVKVMHWWWSCHTLSLQWVLTGMNAEIEAMMAANKAAMEENQEEADVSQEEMASRLGSL